jgi:hypothetical protein
VQFSDWAPLVTKSPAVQFSDWAPLVTKSPAVQFSDWAPLITKSPAVQFSDWAPLVTKSPAVQFSDWAPLVTESRSSDLQVRIKVDSQQSIEPVVLWTKVDSTYRGTEFESRRGHYIPDNPSTTEAITRRRRATYLR